MRMPWWYGWVGTRTGVAALGVAFLAVALLAVPVAAGVARWRMARGSTVSRAWRMSLAEVGMVCGTVPFVGLTMLPGSRAGEVTGAVSLVPLRDLATMSTVQVVGNLLIFAAWGLLAPLRFAALASVPRITALAAAGSVLIETAQYVLRLDRVSSVDDVLLNATGAGLAALLSLGGRVTVRACRRLSLRAQGSAVP